MRTWTICAAGVCLLAMGYAASASPATPAGAAVAEGQPAIVLAQAEKPKPTETVEHKVKRVWRKLTGYKFNVSCLFSNTVCTETGKDREVARAKCQSAHPFCSVTDAR